MWDFEIPADLAIVDPIPLPVGCVVSFYDGQPRDNLGRFARGRRMEVAGDTGFSAAMPAREADMMLKTRFAVATTDGRYVVFAPRLLEKYNEGVGRHGKGGAPERLKHLARAVHAIRNSRDIVDFPGDNPPQIAIVERMTVTNRRRGKTKHYAVVVYVEANSREVRGFIYHSGTEASVDRFVAAKSHPR